VTELPAGVRFWLALALCLLALASGGWGVWSLFTAYYFRSGPLFALHDEQGDLTVTTGPTVTREMICGLLRLTNGVNLFSVPIEQKRLEMLKAAPIIRDIRMFRRLPDKLNITVIEREPVARVLAGKNYLVVDEEGVVFNRYAGTGRLPIIKGTDAREQGQRLRGNAMAAVRLVINTLRPECGVRLEAVDAAKADYLLLTFSDYRRAKFAWDGMSDEQKDTAAKMQTQLDHLADTMNSEIGKNIAMWDATLPRIVAMTGGIQ
jgi:cell division septal protein FtsQ